MSRHHSAPWLAMVGLATLFISACAEDGGTAVDACRGVTCINPPPPACEGDEKVSYAALGACVDVDGVALCDYGLPSRQDCAALDKVCGQGQCNSVPVVPCEGVTCNTQPPADCDGTIARVFESTGTCNPAIPPAGACEYPVAATLECATSNKECRAGACIDPGDFPCDPNPCDVPPQGTCAGSVPTGVAPTGTCTPSGRTASCTYAPVTLAACPGGQTCYLGHCATSLAAPAAAGDVIIDELLVNPTSAEDTGEWVELYNPLTVARTLDGCILRDDGGEAHTIAPTTPLILPPGGYVVLGRSALVADNQGFAPDYVYGGFVLGNAGDEVVLECGGTVIDAVRYTDGGWPNRTGVAMSLSATKLVAAANDLPGAWCEAPTAYGNKVQKGTPRRANPACP